MAATRYTSTSNISIDSLTATLSVCEHRDMLSMCLVRAASWPSATLVRPPRTQCSGGAVAVVLVIAVVAAVDVVVVEVMSDRSGVEMGVGVCLRLRHSTKHMMLHKLFLP
ncbi:unnamed protein product [Polarella glacialis]|uniref:Uncharacterized protein n=1 Tax=Polarella glacialis TaxID=89957 RepID=A0A813KCL0_POLGL|nr:unnamed protein product [Polarella glacialis]